VAELVRRIADVVATRAAERRVRTPQRVERHDHHHTPQPVMCMPDAHIYDLIVERAGMVAQLTQLHDRGSLRLVSIG